MAKGSLEMKGAGTGFEGIGVDIKPLMKQLENLRKQINDDKVQRRIHREVGKLYKDEMKNNIKDAREVIRIRRGKQKPLDIPIGTLNRSVRVWLIDKQANTYWVGPRVGRRMPLDSDGWFANIVEGGDAKFGEGRNKGVFERSIANKRTAAFNLMRERYKRAIRKAAKAKKK
tara:strand:+ start:58 stop:573 length:516 start_codon:yes stop_codon:yes gene_type:complete